MSTSQTPTVSALLIARDEAENLPQAIEALRWADEIVVVVDPASRDATENIARLMADRVLIRPFDDFAHQRNAGLQAVTSDWVFSVDADERSSPAQAAEIRQRLAETHASGFRVPIRSVVLGRPFQYSGTQLDLPLRLFRKNLGRWTGRVHETVQLQGPAETLDFPLKHETLPDLETFLRKINTYTTLEAQKLLDEEAPRRFGDLCLRPIWTFLKLYLARQGFRDGPQGFAFCALSGVSLAVRNWKYRELLSKQPARPELRLMLDPIEHVMELAA